MVTDQQVRRLRKLIQTEKTLVAAAAKAGMDEKTARKYRDLDKLPSEVKVKQAWRTRADPFAEVWEEMKAKLGINPGLQRRCLRTCSVAIPVALRMDNSALCSAGSRRGAPWKDQPEKSSSPRYTDQANSVSRTSRI